MQKFLIEKIIVYLMKIICCEKNSEWCHHLETISDSFLSYMLAFQKHVICNDPYHLHQTHLHQGLFVYGWYKSCSSIGFCASLKVGVISSRRSVFVWLKNNAPAWDSQLTFMQIAVISTTNFIKDLLKPITLCNVAPKSQNILRILSVTHIFSK